MPPYLSPFACKIICEIITHPLLIKKKYGKMFLTMLKLFNTLTRKKEDFKPWRDKKVGLYTCGPTVYNYAHIGNLRTYVFEDILNRALRYNDFKINQVMNITDVGHLTSDEDMGEDKMEKGARREKKTAWEIAEFYTKAFKDDIKKKGTSLD